MNMATYQEAAPQKRAPIVPRTEAAAIHAARGAEAERERLRKGLHDGVGQLLTSISFLASSLSSKLGALQMPEAEQAEDILALTRQAISETQALVAERESPATGA